MNIYFFKEKIPLKSNNVVHVEAITTYLRRIVDGQLLLLHLKFNILNKVKNYEFIVVFDRTSFIVIIQT